MKARISVLTIGANNLTAMKNFYSHILGWKPVVENNDIVFYQLNGFLLSICNKKMLADFIGIDAAGQGFRAVTIGYNVNTKEEVLSLFDELSQKGVNILKEPTEPPFGGLFFYFTDVEGNILEVAYNPFVIFDENGNVIGHKPINHL